jgi:peptide/nickel transport system substrate-binding protein
MSKEAYETLGPDEFATHPSGTGPFMLEEWVPNDHLLLVKNPDYNWAPEWTGHTGPANVDEILYRIIPEDVVGLIELEAGNVDLMITPPLRELGNYQGDPDYIYITVPRATIWFVGMNVKSPIVGDIRTRQAIGHAIDRDLLSETIFQRMGRPTTTYLAGELGADKGVSEVAPSFDLDKAAELFAEAGWVMGDDGILVAENVADVDAGTKFEVEYWTYQDDQSRRVAEATQRMLADVGIKAEIQLMDNPTYSAELEGGGHSIILRRYTWDNADILPWFHHSQYVPMPNYLGVNDPDLDAMMDNADYATSTWAERSEGYREAHKYLIETYYPWAPIFQSDEPYLARSRVRNFRPIPLRGLMRPEVWTLIDLEQ